MIVRRPPYLEPILNSEYRLGRPANPTANNIQEILLGPVMSGSVPDSQIRLGDQQNGLHGWMDEQI